MILLACWITICRPHPNECSGGDLDGDLFSIYWDERLVPPMTVEPMHYISRRSRLMDHKITLEVCLTYSNFYKDCLIKINLVLFPFQDKFNGIRLFRSELLNLM